MTDGIEAVQNATVNTGGGADAGASSGAAATASMTDEQILDMPSVAGDTSGAAPTDGAAAKPTEGDAAKPGTEAAKPAADAAKPDVDAAGRDWRTVPQELRETLRANPKLGDLFFEHQAFKGSFATPQEAATVAQVVTQLGGAEKLPDVVKEYARAQEQDAVYFGKDPQALAGMHDRMVREALTSEDPDTYVRNFRAGATALAKWQPEAYGQMAMEILPSALDATGFTQMTRFAEQIIAAKNGDRALELAQHLVDYSKSLQGQAKEKPVEQQRTAEDPARAQLQKDQQEFAQQKVADFNSGTNESISTGIRADIGAALTKTLPEGTQPGAKQRIEDEIFRELNTELAADQNLTKQIVDAFASFRAKGHGELNAALREKIVGLMKARAQQLLPKTAEKVINDWTSGVMSRHTERTKKLDAAASRNDVGAGSGPAGIKATPKLERGKLNYREVSDDQILSS